jgi:cation:H+ antiporter
MISSINQGVPNLAAGNIFGSNMFNMFMLAVLDLMNPKTRILRRIATTHALSAGLAILLMAFAVFAMLAEIELRVAWVGWDSLLIMGAYLGGVRLIQGGADSRAPASEENDDDKQVMSLWRAIAGFLLATGVLIGITPWLVQSSVGIAEITGLSTGFVGALLVAIVTSLPEVVTTLAAVRFGAYDLAVGNLFGSNIFNIFALGLTDIFYVQGRFLGAIDPAFAIAGLLGILLTCLGLIGNLARVNRRLLFVEFDALLILIGYILGMWLLYARGLGL